MTGNKYFNMIVLGLKEQLIYVRAMLFRQFLMVTIMIIFVNLWSVVYQGQTEINGHSYNQVIWYLLITEAFFMSRAPVAYKIADEIKSGTFAYTSSRPYSYALYHFFVSLGDSSFKLLTNFIVGAVLVMLLGIKLNISFLAILCFFLVMLIGYIIDYCLQFMIGTFSFIQEEISGYVFIYEKLLFIFGGIIFPLSILSNHVEQLFFLMPFVYVIGFPAQLLTQGLSELNILYLGLQLLYLMIFIISAKACYTSLRKKTMMNGG